MAGQRHSWICRACGGKRKAGDVAPSCPRGHGTMWQVRPGDEGAKTLVYTVGPGGQMARAADGRPYAWERS